MNIFRPIGTTPRWNDQDPPDAESCLPFSVTPLYCGSNQLGFTPTDKYVDGDLTAADAVAMSGAAVTPFMVQNVGLTALMAAFNLRIGQWLPRPGLPDSHKAMKAANGWRVGREFLKATFESYRNTWRLGLVADGGFHEFFGLEELLMRQCRLIVVSDAGCNNGKYEFGALADVMRQMRSRMGLSFLKHDEDVPVDMSDLERKVGGNRQSLHHLCFRVRYPDSFNETTVVYLQMSLTGDEELDLLQFGNVNPMFPDEPTTNQRYSTEQVESYRQLGYHIGAQLFPTNFDPGKANITSPEHQSDEWRKIFEDQFHTKMRQVVERRAEKHRTESQSLPHFVELVNLPTSSNRSQQPQNGV